MATVTPTQIGGSGVRTVTETSLAAGNHTFTYRPGTGQILIMRNATGVVGTFRISGADGVTWGVPGAGDQPVTPFLMTNLAPGAIRIVCLDEVRAYMQGVITFAITGTTMIAVLLNP